MAKEVKENPLTRINNDIAAGTFAPVYLLYGEEEYLVKQTKDNLLKALIPEDNGMNLNRYEGKDTSVPQMIDVAETMPFFADRRVILCEDTGFFKTSQEELASYLENIPESCVFLFVESEVDARSKTFKAVKEHGYPAKFERQSGEMLTKWVLARVKREKKQISRDTLDRFFELAGDDMLVIDRELEKVFCYCLEKDSITTEDVNAVCSGLATDHIFDMTEAIARKDAKTALDLYSDLCVLQVPSAQILSMISGQFHRLLLIKEGKQKGLDNGRIADRLGYKSDYPVRKNLPLASKFTVEQLKSAVKCCVESEESFKTGNMTEELATETLIFTLLKK